MKRRIPIGKKVGSAIYVHRDYIQEMIYDHGLIDHALYEKACFKGLIAYRNWDILKWDKNKGTFSFIYCPMFDEHNEPEVLHVKTVNLLTRKITNRSFEDSKNPPIYHHKWLMVGEDHNKFNLSSAKKRSERIEEVIKQHRIDKKKIGFKKYWEEVVLPLL